MFLNNGSAMNLDATIISVSLIATGVATCILLGNPKMDKDYAVREVAAEKSLQPMSAVLQSENNNHQKLEQLESEVADLREQMAILVRRMAETNQKLSHLQLKSESSSHSDQDVIGYAGPHD
jgi:hypothetical protein